MSVTDTSITVFTRIHLLYTWA